MAKMDPKQDRIAEKSKGRGTMAVMVAVILAVLIALAIGRWFGG